MKRMNYGNYYLPVSNFNNKVKRLEHDIAQADTYFQRASIPRKQTTKK